MILISSKNSHPLFEFHITRKSRDKYQFSEALFSLKGQVIFADFQASRLFVEKLNQRRPVEQVVQAGEVNAMGLLDEIMHFMIETYRIELNPDLFPKIEKLIIDQFGLYEYERLLIAFADWFPTSALYRGEHSVRQYLADSTGNLPNKYVILEELLVLWLDNMNPAYSPISEVIDESDLANHTIYSNIFKALESFFQNEPYYGAEDLPLIELLRLPANKFPTSIMAQLEYIKSRWGGYLAPLILRLLSSMDFIKEEQKLHFDIGLFGPGPTEVLTYKGLEFEAEAFSADLDWMPRLTIIAKSVYVWLDQLSHEYQRSITRLDQAPDEELDRIARYGFTGLWLIGLWERSRASQKIKQINGNPEAAASAYSLYDYEIAQDLGGHEALQDLKQRAWRRGIRLASDMVPNHMGIYSRWVIEHPDWFIQSSYSPFPKYSFTGTDLSDDSRVALFIEDGYWNRTDAAVVFKRLDRWTGDVRYIYHGNDGTSYPWNDTAQLNYLIPEVREAVIQTILHVARMFPIIRFDAAMTLAKRHYQRLWFPDPGSGGDIPSRAEHGLTKARFDEVFPVEFWREVVDRVQQEAPDTLLLAEAFWMMEGYFVRTLGMHRVYNSAFMNMLKNEENWKYRQSIKNVLEYNPQILKRYVNFMNNPDEETAVAQFGKDDKYFGVCILMCTMPGLPMFGHGQIYGFREKYGMEYRKAYWNEQPDHWLVQRHEREIFPLLRMRYLFSDVENYLLYDFYQADGMVNENIYAYSNRFHNEMALVIYNNKYENASGWIRISAAYTNGGGLVHKSLAEGLRLPNNPHIFIIFRDHISGNEYLRCSTEFWEKGLFIELGAFNYQVFLDFREAHHTQERPYADLSWRLQGAPVPSIAEALDEFVYHPIIAAFNECVNPGSLSWLVQLVQNTEIRNDVLNTFEAKLKALNNAISAFEGINALTHVELDKLKVEYFCHMQIPVFDHLPPFNNKKILAGILDLLQLHFPNPPSEQLRNWRVLITLIFIRAIKQLYLSGKPAHFNIDAQRKALFDKVIRNSFSEMQIPGHEINQDIKILHILLRHESGLDISEDDPLAAFMDELLEDPYAREFLKINRYNGVLFFNKEAFEEIFLWLFIIFLGKQLRNNWEEKRLTIKVINDKYRLYKKLLKTAQDCGYRLDEFTNE
jgi:glycosidase